MKVLSSSHAKHCLGYHIVFCPKYRHQVLLGAIEVELKQVIGETCKTYGWTLHSLEVMPDHVHIFVQLDHTTAPVEVVKTVKSISAVKLFTQFPDLKKRKFWGSECGQMGRIMQRLEAFQKRLLESILRSKSCGVDLLDA